MGLKKKVAEHRAAGGIGAAVTLFVGLLFLSPLGEGLSHLSYELPFLFRSNLKVDGVVILYMDDDSHSRLGQKWFQEWDRSVHARLVDRLTEWKARAVVFDILFDERTSEAADHQLVQAAQQHGNVIVAAKVSPHLHEGEVIGLKLVPPFTNALTWGAVELASADKTIRQHYRDRVQHAPSLAWVVAQRTMSSPPSDPAAPRWVNYYGPPGWISSFSYYEVLETNSYVRAALSNKVVFVGGRYSLGHTGGMGTDDFRTPYTRWTGTKSPGVEVNATTYLNLVIGDWLKELPRWGELALLAVCGLVFGYGLMLFRPMPAAGVAVASCFLIALGAILMLWQHGLWFPWLIVCAAQIPCALSCSILAYTRALRQEKESLEARLTTVAPPSPGPYVRGAEPQPVHLVSPYTPSPQIGVAGREAALVPAAGEAGAAPPIPDHTVLRRIGRGSYGEVWLARDVIGTYHAVKVIDGRNFKDDLPYEREFRGIQKFTPISRSHPGFVHILHVGRNDAASYFYYIMELGDDEKSGQRIDPNHYSPRSLASELDQRGRLPASDCVRLGVELSAALQHLHQHGLIHRDIKPSNIIFVNGVAKFADIGLVTDIGGRGKDVTYLGTEGYIAPEGPGTPASDVYSLGKVLYQLNTGLDRRQFPVLPPSLVDQPRDTMALQLKLNRVILKACAAQPSDRFESAGEMETELRALQKQQMPRPKRRFWR